MMQKIIQSTTNYKLQNTDWGGGDKKIYNVARFVSVVILCGSDKFIRDFMLTAHQLHMTGGQYVYVVADQVPPQNVKTPWVAGDDQDETARLAFESVLQVRSVRYLI